MNAKSVRRRTATALAAGLFSAAVMAPSASADSWVTGCYSYNAGASATCVMAMMGGKNYATKRQWVGEVRTEVRGICYDRGTTRLESWGDGFYFNNYYTASCRRTAGWAANRWVASGTNICGAATDYYGNRRIACIRISV